MQADTDWIDIGNDESSAIVYDFANVGNYQALRVRPGPDGRWRAEVNGAFRGSAKTRAAARDLAVSFAHQQIAD